MIFLCFYLYFILLKDSSMLLTYVFSSSLILSFKYWIASRNWVGVKSRICIFFELIKLINVYWIGNGRSFVDASISLQLLSIIVLNNNFNLLALLPIGPALHSISSYFRTSILICWSSTRTELAQKWSLLVRIRTIVERTSIYFFEPGDLRFRPDSGQMEEDLDEVQLALLNPTIFALEELQQARGQSEEDLIFNKTYKRMLIIILFIFINLNILVYIQI